MNKRVLCIAVLLCLGLVGFYHVHAVADSSVTQWGITWYFDEDHTVGQFANGDPWVLGPVTITSITPDYDGTNNGWEVNPVVEGGQGFQSGCAGEGFEPSLVPSLPYTTPPSGIVSIVKTINNMPEQRPCIKTAAVLTVVSEVPPGNGETVFRPPYIGKDKPYYHVADLRTDLLPGYARVGEPPTLAYIEERFRRVRLDHKRSVLGRALRPVDSMRDYQPKNSEDLTNAALCFMLDHGSADISPALIQYIQAGIDKVHTILDGQTWPSGGGHQPAHIIMSSFTATLLDIGRIKSVLEAADFFHASNFLKFKNKEGRHLWGGENTESRYWAYIRGLGGARSNQDPYGFIDGGTCGAAYQMITSQSHKGEVLAAHLMPALQSAWPDPDLAYATDYVERWVGHGTWSQPDPCAPYTESGIYGTDYGPDPDNPGMCILDNDLAYYNSPVDFACKAGAECGRYPGKHGTQRDDGQYKSEFVKAMWDVYWEASQGDGKMPGPPVDLRVMD